ncbi:MAG: adenosylcobinamide-phosphate synthase CbiB [Deltaproteobacteria bacterium]
MRLEYQILVAVALDLVIGDPRWFPHPVKLIGRLALLLEEPFRRLFTNQYLSGAVAAVSIISITAAGSYAVIWLAATVHPAAGDAVSILLIYTGIAARDMIRHSTEVWRALRAGDIEQARVRVGMICGRDTDRLEEPGIVGATVESVAENLVDGVTAPLFFAFIGGPVGVMAYKAVSTLDSSFGYKNERYRDFGWASARLDDIAAFVPSRLTAILVPVAALVAGQRSWNSLKIFLRDRSKHPSPNAGQSEAAFAGALGVQLGGLSYYDGRPSNKPKLGDPLSDLSPGKIRDANTLMAASSLCVLAVLLGLDALLVHVWFCGSG